MMQKVFSILLIASMSFSIFAMQNNFDFLPDELTLEVIRKLDNLSTVQKLSYTCRRFRRLCTDHILIPPFVSRLSRDKKIPLIVAANALTCPAGRDYFRMLLDKFICRRVRTLVLDPITRFEFVAGYCPSETFNKGHFFLARLIYPKSFEQEPLFDETFNAGREAKKGIFLLFLDPVNGIIKDLSITKGMVETTRWDFETGSATHLEEIKRLVLCAETNSTLFHMFTFSQEGNYIGHEKIVTNR